MKETKRSPLGLYTIGIAALFLAGFFLLVVFGAGSYRDTVAGQRSNMQGRELSSYLATVLKGGDRQGAVELRTDSTYGTVLVIGDEALEPDPSVYALRIYLWENRLVEEYARADAPLSPDSAQVIGDTGTFSVTKEGGLMTLRTDAGEVLVYLRSEGGRDR